MCGATTAFALDEESAEVEDATPTGTMHARVAWRLLIALLPFTVGAAAMPSCSATSAVQPDGCGSCGGGRERGHRDRARIRAPPYGPLAPGELAGALTFGLIVLVVALEPLGAWVSLAPLESPTYPLSTAVAWALRPRRLCGRARGVRAQPGPSDHPKGNLVRIYRVFASLVALCVVVQRR